MKETKKRAVRYLVEERPQQREGQGHSPKAGVYLEGSGRSKEARKATVDE